MPTPQPPPPTMRAWAYTTRGPIPTVLHPTTLPTPALDPSTPNLLIRITHASLTPSIARLTPLIPTLLSRPYIPELGFSGTIALTTPTTPRRLGAPGTPVFGSLPLSAQLLHGAGTLAQYLVARPEDLAVAAPAAALPLEQAAGLDGNGQTALQMVRNAGVRAGSRVFVNGGTGAVGTLVVQVAKAVGAEVVATGSGEEGRALVEGLGADVVVDYRECGEGGLVGWLAERYGESKFDVVLDVVGTRVLYERCPEFLKEEGVFGCVGAMEGMLTGLVAAVKNTWWPRVLGGTPRRYFFQRTPPTQEGRGELVRLVQEGKLRVVVDSVFDMEDALGAYERNMSQRAKGKVIVRIQDA